MPSIDTRFPHQPGPGRPPHMMTKSRGLAMTIRALTSEAEIAYVLHSLAIHGRDPGPVTRAVAERAVAEALATGSMPPPPDGVYPAATIAERAVAMKMLTERGFGTPSDGLTVEETIRKVAAGAVSRPDYSRLSDEELATMRALLKKATPESRAAQDHRVQAQIDAARAAGAE